MSAIGKTEAKTVPDLFDVEAEQSLLGAVMRDNPRYWSAAELVAIDDFSDPLHQRIWKRIGENISKELSASAAMIAMALRDDPGTLELQKQSGDNYVKMLHFCGAGADISALALLISGYARRRRVVAAASAAIDAAYDMSASADVVADEAGEAIYDAAHREGPSGGLRPIYEIVCKAAELANAARENPGASRILTGLASVDTALGGLFPGDLTVLGAAPNMGKTGVVQQFALSMARQGYFVAVFSKEMQGAELGLRYLAQDIRVPSNRLLEGRSSEEDTRAAFDAISNYADLPLFIDDASNLTVAQIRARCHGLKRRKGVLHVVAVDHLRFIRPERPRDDYAENMNQITRDLKSMAKELGVAVLLISHLNRDFWKRPDHRPIVSDLYGASAIEQNADHIWFLHREEFYLVRAEPDRSDAKAHTDWLTKLQNAKGVAELFGAKRRMGPTGRAMLKFDAPFVTFTDLEERAGQEPNNYWSER